MDMSTANTSNSTDLLTPTLTKVFEQMGNDTSSPEVQKEIATRVQQMRATNPGTDDATLAKNVNNNLPQMVNSVMQNKPIEYGANDRAQVDAVNTQRLQDVKSADGLRPLSTLTMSRLPGAQGGDAAAQTNFVDSAFNPSKAMQANLDGNRKDELSFYTNQNEKGVANEQQEKTTQAGIKTKTEQIAYANLQTVQDPNSDVSKAMRSTVSAQMKAMGVSDADIAKLSNLSAAQIQVWVNQFTDTEKKKLDMAKVVQDTLTGKSTAGANWASAGASNASAAKTREETKGVQSDNVVKKFKADSIGKDGGMPEAVANDVMSAGKNSNRIDNQNAAATMNADAAKLKNTQETAAQLLHELNDPKTNTGYLWNKTKALNSSIQSINKLTSQLQAGQQGSGGGTAASADAIAGANPDGSINKDVIKQAVMAYLGRAAIDAQVRDKTVQQVQDGTHATFQRGAYASSLTPITVIQNGQVISVDAYEPKDIAGAVAVLRQRYPGAYVGPSSAVNLNQLR